MQFVPLRQRCADHAWPWRAGVTARTTRSA